MPSLTAPAPDTCLEGVIEATEWVYCALARLLAIVDAYAGAFSTLKSLENVRYS